MAESETCFSCSSLLGSFRIHGDPGKVFCGHECYSDELAEDLRKAWKRIAVLETALYGIESTTNRGNR